MYKPDRRTGRTTELVKKAVAIALRNHHVIIVVGNQAEVQRISRMVYDYSGGMWNPMLRSGRIKVVEPSYFDFIDARTLRVRVNGRPLGKSDKVLWDHYAIEKMYQPVLDALYGGDPECLTGY